ncbi:enoyl-CoA hydratase/isomerase family protein [Nocardia neocaledoniensis]|uniref:enoyl-CoA hydratase/isomerase family protein n=1 Tax=Nocardia neocaledoniensis TaxID=236511 RepID=UPI0024573DD4|nr:enoyl-CoA hydratase/isomerase family protein [Nocardia neocaledoniensis]
MPTENAGAVEVHRDGTVAVITLRRERKRNALSTHMEAELLGALRTTEVRTSHAVVLTGGESVFSAGADVTELRSMTPEAIAEYYRASGSVYEVLAGLPQPTVSAITGYCLGGGLELALATDIRVADPGAVFGFPEIGIGILPSSGGVARITRIVGVGRARDLVLRGRRFDIAEAERWGVVSETADPAGHIAHALRIAHDLAAYSPLALSVTKQVLTLSADTPHHAALLLEQLAYSALNKTTP